MFTATDIAGMRETAEAAMPNTATRLTLSTASDGAGGVTETWGTASTAIPCRISSAPLSARVGLEGERFTVHDLLILTIPHDQAIALTDHWVVEAITYRVMAIDDAGDWRSARRAEVTRVQA